MCGIDPSELTPFQGGPFIGRFPGLKPRAKSCGPFGAKNNQKRPYLSAILPRLRQSPVCGGPPFAVAESAAGRLKIADYFAKLLRNQ
jgi:hypothetical protein